MVAYPLLSLLLITPGVGIIALGAGFREAAAKVIAFTASVITLALASLLLVDFYLGGILLNLSRSAPVVNNAVVSPATGGGFYAFEKYPWFTFQTFTVSPALGVDGISLPLVWLTALLGSLSILFPMDHVYRPRLYYAMLLLIQLALTGVFASLDMFFFFVFWELVLIPMFFLIGIWGGPNKGYSSMKFLIYTHVGSVGFVLLSIFLLFYTTRTFDLVILLSAANNPSNPLYQRIQGLRMPLFISFLIGFGIKLPMVPFHTWLPDAHVEAPTAGSVLLAGVLLKMGGYGILRVAYGLFPAAAADLWWLVAILGTVSMIYASLVCLVQVDLKRLIAYASIGHMGFVLLGVSSLTSMGLLGASFQLFNHGLVTAVLFMLAGAVHHATGTREIPLLRGLGSRMPIFSSVMILAFLASLGLPSLNSFWSEFMTFAGTFQGWPSVIRYFIIVPLVAVGLTAAYHLWAVQKVVFGDFNDDLEKVRDLTIMEVAPMALLLVFIVFTGFYPTPWVGILRDGVAHLAGGA